MVAVVSGLSSFTGENVSPYLIGFDGIKGEENKQPLKGFYGKEVGNITLS